MRPAAKEGDHVVAIGTHLCSGAPTPVPFDGLLDSDPRCCRRARADGESGPSRRNPRRTGSCSTPQMSASLRERMSQTKTPKRRASAATEAKAIRGPGRRTVAGAAPVDVRVVVNFSQEEYAMLLEVADAELRPLSNWLRVSVLDAFRARSKRGSRSSRAAGEAPALRPLQVMARVSEDERDMLDVLAGEAGTTVSGWLRATVRSAYAKLPEARSNAS